MKNTVRIFSILLLSLVFLGGCSSQLYHDYIMSGQVVNVDGKEVVVCVSNTDSMKEHDVFNVYRTVYDDNLDLINEGETNYSRQFVGKIRLGDKIDKHFAKAVVVTGDLIRYDMVEFE